MRRWNGTGLGLETLQGLRWTAPASGSVSQHREGETRTTQVWSEGKTAHDHSQMLIVSKLAARSWYKMLRRGASYFRGEEGGREKNGVGGSFHMVTVLIKINCKLH